MVRGRPRSLEDFEELIGVLARRRRYPSHPTALADLVARRSLAIKNSFATEFHCSSWRYFFFAAPKHMLASLL